MAFVMMVMGWLSYYYKGQSFHKARSQPLPWSTIATGSDFEIQLHGDENRAIVHAHFD